MALVRIQLRRDTAANWASANPVLANGEPGLETDTGKIKYGNGSQNWAALPYAANTPLSNTSPPAVGTAATGSSASAARADHTHAIPAALSVQSLTTSGDVVVGGGATITGTLTATKLAAPAASITDLPEAVQDIVGDALKAGDGINVVYNDAAGTITVSAAGGAGGVTSSLTLEQVDDRVAALLQAGDGISLSYDDGNDRLTISADEIDGGPIPPGPAPEPTEFRISANPVSVDTEAGTTATFTAAATGGTGAYTYQWQRMVAGSGTWNNVSNGANYAGATTRTLSVLAIPASFNRSWFRCAVTNGATTRYTTGARLDVNYFEITVQPVSTTATVGSTTPATTFSVTAVSDDPITYQWQLLTSGAWGNVAGATSSTYGSISATAPGDGSGFYAYRCAVTSNGVTLYTNQVNLGIVEPPVTITVQPTSQTAAAGAATFTVTYTGGTSPTVRWQVQRVGSTAWADIPGQTTTTLSLVNLVMGDSGNLYRAVITSGTVVVFSNAVALTVPGPIITSQPLDAIASLGAASFTFAYTGGSGSVQWWRRPVGSVSWTSIAGQSGTTLSLTGLTAADTGREYSATVTLAGITVRTRAALLTVPADVFFSQQPQPVTVQAGQQATFSFNTTFAVTADRYVVWQYKTPGSTVWLSVMNAAGVQNNQYGLGPNQAYRTFSITSALTLSGNVYRVIVYRGTSVATSTDSVTSEPALLTVTQAPAALGAVLPPNRPLGMTEGGWYPRSPLQSDRSGVSHERCASFAYGRGVIIGVSHGGVLNRGRRQTIFGAGAVPNPQGITETSSQKIDRPTASFIYSADDGASWAVGTLPVSACWYGIAFGAGRFVAVGCDSEESGTMILAVSDDAGASWTSRVFGRGNYVIPRVAGSNDAGFLISAGGWIFQGDGWTLTNRGLGSFSAAARVAGKWVRVFNDTSLSYSSDNGATWTNIAYATNIADTTVEAQAILSSNGTRAVALANGKTAKDGQYLYSTTDGIAWNYQPLTFESQCGGLGAMTEDTSSAVAVALSGSDLFYAGYAFCDPVAGANVYSQVVHRSPAATPHSASRVYSASEAKPYTAANSYLVLTDMYAVAIDTIGGTVARFPLTVSPPTQPFPDPTQPPQDDGRPFAPQQVSAGAATSTTVTVSWVAPTSAGASSITDYLVEYSSDAGRTWTTFNHPASAETSITVTGLTAGTQYVFRISAINSYGTGPASAASNQASPSGVPAPAPVSVGAAQIASPMGNSRQPSFSLTWQPPASNGGSAVTGYIVQQRVRSYFTDRETGQRAPWEEWSSLPSRNTTTVADGAYNRWATVSGTTATVSNIAYPSGMRVDFQHRVAAVNTAGPGAWGEGNVVNIVVGR